MPKRSNEFQRFIKQLETLLAPEGATVTESKMVRDRTTNRLVEVDVVLESRQGPRPVAVGIECRDTRRKCDTPWIDQLYGRLRSLELDKIVAVSKKGFTAGAVEKARALGIETIDMNAKKVVSWLSMFSRLPHIVVRETIKPFFTGADLHLLDHAHPRPMSVEESRKVTMYAPDGASLQSLAHLGDWFAQSEEVAKFLERDASPLGDYSCTATADLVPGVTIEIDGVRRALPRLTLHLRTISTAKAVPVKHMGYGTADVATAEFDIRPLNQRVKMILAQDEGGAPKMSLHYEKVAPPTPAATDDRA